MLSGSRKLARTGLEDSRSNYFSLAKKRMIPLRFASSRYARIKTQGNENNVSMIPLNFKEEKAHTASLHESRKEHVMVRQQRLRKEYDEYKQKLGKGDNSGSLKKRGSLSLELTLRKEKKKPLFAQTINNLNLKDLECNMLHFIKIFDCLLRKRDAKIVIQRIKGYILEEESDLNELQLFLEDKNEQLNVKSILFYERILLIMLVQSIINKRYRFIQQNFMLLFKDILSFYTFLYEQISEKKISKFIQLKQLKAVLPYLSQKNKDQDMSVIRQRISKRIVPLSKHCKEIFQFMNRQLGCIKSYPSNLLYYKLLQFYASKLTLTNVNGWGIQFLLTCPSPYVHHTPEKKYTLLLDLDQTLVHYQCASKNEGEFLLRPHLFSFLSKLEPHYELGIFTCALQTYADAILEHLPSITIRLYRQHAVKVETEMIKDLSRVGRDLSQMILVDNLERNFQFQKENGIHVRSWYGDPKDNILQILGNELEELALSNPNDLRLSAHRRSFL